ncbi:MAG: DUF2974 domain-containing protein [Clostridia bacterium]|nr:DUF2974 domain-containing protein [Clostridia bacterium]
MSNMLDYIRWRGDLPMDLIPVCEVDGLILAQLSMMNWPAWLGDSGDDKLSLATLRGRLDIERISVGFTGQSDRMLMELITASARFGEIRVLDYSHTFNAESQTQFAALSLLLPGGLLFVAFQGTDNSLVGWKEDFNMAYSRPVPAQQMAAAYLERAARLVDGPIVVGGHSKGGNLAVYASAMASEEVLGRILTVYSYDGPGLSDRMDAEPLYARLGGRLRAFVPQSSVVGMLLSHPDTFEVVLSSSVGVLQHNSYTWQVEGGRLVRAEALNPDSVYFESVFRKWMSGMDELQREAVVETLFNILSATKAARFDRAFFVGLLKNPVAVFNAARGADAQVRTQVSAALSELAEAVIHPEAEKTPSDRTPTA